VTSAAQRDHYVNGNRSTETKLATGDEVQIGKFKLYVLPRRGSRRAHGGHAQLPVDRGVLVAVKTSPRHHDLEDPVPGVRGLIEPERTRSGYRKFYVEDVDRLKSILRCSATSTCRSR